MATTKAYPKPDFLIIGAQKSGTTWLWRMIEQHPHTDLPKTKEIHYFGSSELYHRGRDWYYDHFARLDGKKITGEASTTYLYDKVPYWRNRATDLVFDESLPSIPELVDQELPGIKIMAVLRNPVKRAVSAYHHLMRRKAILDLFYDKEMSPAMGIEELAQKLPKKRILEYGFYSKYLKKWMEIIPQDRIKVFIFEDDVVGNPERTVSETYRFLGIEHGYRPPALREPANKSWGWTRILAAYYLPAFMQNMIKNKAGRALDRYNILKSLAVKPRDINFLKETYSMEKQNVEDLLDKKIPWNI